MYIYQVRPWKDLKFFSTSHPCYSSPYISLSTLFTTYNHLIRGLSLCLLADIPLIDTSLAVLFSFIDATCLQMILHIVA